MKIHNIGKWDMGFPFLMLNESNREQVMMQRRQRCRRNNDANSWRYAPFLASYQICMEIQWTFSNLMCTKEK